MFNLYTTYMANLKKIKKDTNTMYVIIMQFPPYFLTELIEKEKNYIHCKELAPSKKILLKYKKDKDFCYFKEKYIEEINTNEKKLTIINDIIQALNYNNVCFICCEKDKNFCHRTLLANFIMSICNCKVLEL